MSWPTLIARIAFASGAFAASPSWSNVSTDLLSFAIRRGRQHELDRIEAGTAEITLLNTGGNYWPNNAGGSYYGNVLPGKRVNLRAIYPAVTVLATFNAADSAVSLPTTETFHAWTAVSGTWGISSNEGYCVSDADGNVATVAAGLANGAFGATVKGDLNPVAYRTPGIVFRYNDASNYLVAYLFDGNAVLAKVDGGAFTVLQQDATASTTDDTAYHLQVVASGSTVQIYVDGTLRVTWTLSGGDLKYVNYTTAGMRLLKAGAPTSNARWENFYCAAVTPASVPILYDLYTGYVESWRHGFLGSQDNAPAVTLVCADALKALALYKINSAGYVQELSNVRVGNVLDALGWPSADRTLATGQSTVQASGALVNANALSHLRDVEATEGGLLFVGPDGKVVFQDRNQRLSSTYLTSQATYGDDPAELPYSDLGLEYDDQRIYNDVRFTRTGGSEQATSDATSQTTYGIRTLTRSGLLQTGNAEVLSQANYYLARLKDAEFRVRSLVVKPEGSPANVWPDVLGFDLSTRITVRLDIGSVNTDYYVEGIEHRAAKTPQQWETGWAVNPTSAQEWWTLGTSALGTGTRLAY